MEQKTEAVSQNSEQIEKAGQNEKTKQPEQKKADEEKEVQKQEKELNFLDVLKMLAPGTAIRVALDDLLRANMGALIVVEKEKLFDIVEGGFKISCKFSPQRLIEFAKMDGAIIISNDFKKILYVNTLLVPKIDISTRETGTRHKAAERAAKQIKTIVIAVSERKNKITIYYGDEHHVLEESSEILRRAAETLQILEKQREIYDDLLANLNIMEINNLVTITDVSNVLQRIEIVGNVASIVKRYLVELGKEGAIVSMRLKELMKNISREKELILKDYFAKKHLRAETILKNMNFDFLLETSNISRLLFGELHDKPISPSGVRILSKTNLLITNKKSLIDIFKTLDKLLDANEEALMKVLKKKEERISRIFPAGIAKPKR